MSRLSHVTSLKWGLLLLFALFVFWLSMSVGGGSLGAHELTTWLFSSDLLSDGARFIFSELRLPRTMACLTVGFALGLAGRLLQSLLQNPLAEPYTLGLSGGATLGAVGAILLQIEPLSKSVPLSSLIGSFGATLLLLSFSKLPHLWQSKALVLVGLMISLFCGSLVSLSLSLMRPNELQHALSWMMGQVGTVRDQMWPTLLAVDLLSFAWGYARARDLDSLLLGEELALSAGYRVKSIRLQVIIVVALLTGLAVSISGLIGFVGLLAPHFAEKLTQSVRHRLSLLLSGLSGALLLTLSDTVARDLGHGQELPVGGVVAVIGAPLLVLLILREARRASI